MSFYGALRDLYGLLWVSVNLYGVSMHFYSARRGLYELLWVSMSLYGALWVPRNPYGSQWAQRRGRGYANEAATYGAERMTSPQGGRGRRLSLDAGWGGEEKGAGLGAHKGHWGPHK